MTSRAWLTAAIAGLAVACSRAPVPAAAAEDTAPPPPASSTAPSAPSTAPSATAAEPVEWQLTATPATLFPMADRGTFQLWIVAHNAGTVPADTERHRLAFQVNGKGSHSLSMAFGNGLRERRWNALAPGDTVREARGGPSDPVFGEELFPSAGDYELAMLQGGRVVATLNVRVVAGR
jgi:hypothetical protein